MMQFVFNLLSEQTVIMAGQLLISAKIKSSAKGNKAITQVIPWINLLLTYAGYTVLPASAHAASVLAPVAPQVGALAGGLIQTVLVTGTHGFYKNALKPLFKPLLLNLASLVIKKAGGTYE